MIKDLMLIFPETKLSGITCKSLHRPLGFIKWVYNQSLHSVHAGRLHRSRKHLLKEQASQTEPVLWPCCPVVLNDTPAELGVSLPRWEVISGY